MGIVSKFHTGGEDDLQRHQKIESLVKGLQEIFGPRAQDIARKQYAAATVGSETAEAWRLILDELTLPTRSFPRAPDGPTASEPHQP